MASRVFRSALRPDLPAANLPPMAKEIELFRADTPASKGITAAQLQDVVAGYNATVNPAPVVMGHPANDQSAPAFGVIESVRADGSSLFGTVANWAKEAVDAVKARRILNRSVAFWSPEHPSNPTPGKLALRHLGLLGGSPPAIPNMAPLAFAADDDGNEQLVAEVEPAEAIVFTAAPAAPEPHQVDVPALAAAVVEHLSKSAPKKEFAVPMTEEQLAAREAEFAAREAELKTRETAVDAKETQFAADEARRAKEAKEAREAANATFAAELVTAGKFPAGHKDDLTAILNALPTETLQFSEGKTEAPAEALKRILGQADAAITFGATDYNGATKTSPGDAEQKALAEANNRMAEAYKTPKA